MKGLGGGIFFRECESVGSEPRGIWGLWIGIESRILLWARICFIDRIEDRIIQLPDHHQLKVHVSVKSAL